MKQPLVFKWVCFWHSSRETAKLLAKVAVVCSAGPTARPADAEIVDRAELGPDGCIGALRNQSSTATTTVGAANRLLHSIRNRVVPKPGKVPYAPRRRRRDDGRTFLR